MTRLVVGVPAWHLGTLHPYEHALVYLLAFGPFVLLAVTVWVTRRRSDDGDLGRSGLGQPVAADLVLGLERPEQQPADQVLDLAADQRDVHLDVD